MFAIDLRAVSSFITANLPALGSGFIGGLLAEPIKAWFIEPLKAKALIRQRMKMMRTDLYGSLTRDFALLRRLQQMQALKEWPVNEMQVAGESSGSTPRQALEKWLNGNLLEDFHTETFDEWRRAFPTEYLLLDEADIVRDFYKRLKLAVDSCSSDLSFQDKLDKFLYAYSWLLGHVRQGLLDQELFKRHLEKTEGRFNQRRSAMIADLERTRPFVK